MWVLPEQTGLEREIFVSLAGAQEVGYRAARIHLGLLGEKAGQVAMRWRASEGWQRFLEGVRVPVGWPLPGWGGGWVN